MSGSCAHEPSHRVNHNLVFAISPGDNVTGGIHNAGTRAAQLFLQIRTREGQTFELRLPVVEDTERILASLLDTIRQNMRRIVPATRIPELAQGVN